MSHLVIEVLLRLSKIVAAAIVGLILYVLLTGPFGLVGSPELALLAFVAAAVGVLLVESSPI